MRQSKAQNSARFYIKWGVNLIGLLIIIVLQIHSEFSADVVVEIHQMPPTFSMSLMVAYVVGGCHGRLLGFKVKLSLACPAWITPLALRHILPSRIRCPLAKTLLERDIWSQAHRVNTVHSASSDEWLTAYQLYLHALSIAGPQLGAIRDASTLQAFTDIQNSDNQKGNSVFV